MLELLLPDKEEVAADWEVGLKLIDPISYMRFEREADVTRCIELIAAVVPNMQGIAAAVFADGERHVFFSEIQLSLFRKYYPFYFGGGRCGKKQLILCEGKTEEVPYGFIECCETLRKLQEDLGEQAHAGPIPFPSSVTGIAWNKIKPFVQDVVDFSYICRALAKDSARMMRYYTRSLFASDVFKSWRDDAMKKILESSTFEEIRAMHYGVLALGQPFLQKFVDLLYKKAVLRLIEFTGSHLATNERKRFLYTVGLSIAERYCSVDSEHCQRIQEAQEADYWEYSNSQDEILPSDDSE